VAKRKVPASVQGIYKTLRELVSEDIVVKQKKNYSVSSVWREKLTRMVSQREPFALSEGEEVVYRFNKMDHTDAFWKHTFADLAIGVKDFPVFHFTPRQFWSFVPGRRESELEYYKNLERSQIHAYTVIGGESELDKEAQQLLKNSFHQVHLDSAINFNRRDHLSVIGPYIITTRVSVTLARVTDRLYETCFTEKELQEKLEPEFKKHGSVIMTVEYNEDKAKKMRKKMSADFHIPRELRETFELF
jgi:hypothetical protein